MISVANARLAAIANKLLRAAAAARSALAPAAAAAGPHIARQKGCGAFSITRVASQPTKLVGARRHRSVTVGALTQRPGKGSFACAAAIRPEGVLVEGDGSKPVARVPLPPAVLVSASRVAGEAVRAVIAEVPHYVYFAGAAAARPKGVTMVRDRGLHVAIVADAITIFAGAARIAEVPRCVCFASAATAGPKGGGVVRSRPLRIACVADARALLHLTGRPREALRDRFPSAVVISVANAGLAAITNKLLLAAAAARSALAPAAAAAGPHIARQKGCGAFSITRVASQPTKLVGARRHRSVTVGALTQRPGKGSFACAAAIRPEGVLVEGDGSKPVARVPLPPAVLVSAGRVAGEAVRALIAEVPHYVCFAGAAAIGPGTVGVVRGRGLHVASVADARAPLHLTGRPREALRARGALRPRPVGLACAAGVRR